MKKPLSSLDRIEVAQPCMEDWNEMTGNDEVRFCSHCAKNVHNISSITRKQAKKLVAQSNGRLCIRYIRRPDGRIQTAGQKLYQITGRASQIAASIFGATLTLSTLANAQTPPPSPETSVVRIHQLGYFDPIDKDKGEEIKTESGFGKISGTITDQNGAVIPNIFAHLINQETKQTLQNVYSNENGFYQFLNVPTGNYQVRFKAVVGFQTTVIENVVVTDEVADVKVDTTMNVAVGTEMVGLITVEAAVYETPLIQAVQQEDLAEITKLISSGANVNEKDSKNQGMTALHVAVDNGNLEVVQLLLNYGAKVNARNYDKSTPLLMIDSDATPELVQKLLAYGARVKVKNNFGFTPLHRAALNENTEIIRLLITHGADVDAQDEEGKTALMIAVNNGGIEIIKALLELGANPNLKDKEGENALFKTDEDAIIELLKQYGATEDKEDS